MDFQLSEDQLALRAGVRELLAGRFPRGRLRAYADGPGEGDGASGPGCGPDRGLDRGLWRELGEAGFFSLRLPEAEGGAGLGMAEAALVFEEAGRALLPGPVVATHLTAGVVDGAARGDVVVTAADLREARSAVVEHLTDADAVVVIGASGVGVAAADASAAQPMRSVDPLTPLHRLTADALGGVRNVPDTSGSGRFRHEAALLTAAQQCGSAARSVEMAVEYAGTRRQFGRAIGTFQAVKHICAEMLVRAEMARTAVYAAAVTGDRAESAAAKLLADEAAVRNARDCLQVFGGMGFTWEADVHLHLKRAWVRSQLFLGAREAEEALAAALS